tara:strand:- start:147 stop:521 length:375 start_codon:yes stop_codon:yes gene_type:complete
MGCSNSKSTNGIKSNSDGGFVAEIEAAPLGQPTGSTSAGNWLFHESPSSRNLKDDLWDLDDGLDDRQDLPNVHGTLWRVVNGENNENTFIKLWATVEEGMLKYYKSKPKLTDRAMGYINLSVSR